MEALCSVISSSSAGNRKREAAICDRAGKQSKTNQVGTRSAIAWGETREAVAKLPDSRNSGAISQRGVRKDLRVSPLISVTD
jgi:hypothetical protein